MTENLLIKLLTAFATGCACTFMLGGCATAHVVSDDYSGEFQGRYFVSDATGDDTMRRKTIDVVFGEGRTATVTVEETGRVLHLNLSAFLWVRRLNKSLATRLRESLTE
ncbi:hypothetical protein, partial [Burkholderia ubonensis]|uniref:hypothetical protein n=1 Tax=Burkholderia ubonensis TaxID=101571 RepID=UPI000A6861B1